MRTGFNEVRAASGAVKAAQGAPLQEGDTLAATSSEVTANNDIQYALIASYMMPIRDALMCDIAELTESEWLALSEILTVNGIKLTQDL